MVSNFFACFLREIRAKKKLWIEYVLKLKIRRRNFSIRFRGANSTTQMVEPHLLFTTKSATNSLPRTFLPKRHKPRYHLCVQSSCYGKFHLKKKKTARSQHHSNESKEILKKSHTYFIRNVLYTAFQLNIRETGHSTPPSVHCTSTK